MNVWAIADLHLSFSVAEKTMDIFGPLWAKHYEKIQKYWKTHISDDDLILIPGDISWAMYLEEAKIDLEWIDSLPGTKVLIRGNHDYWWKSLKKLTAVLPPSINVIQNNAFHWDDVSIAGARLWETDEFNFDQIHKHSAPDPEFQDKEQNTKIFKRELHRLELSLKKLDPDKKKIAMIHFPPIGLDLAPSQVSLLLEKYQVDICVFGHLHNINTNQKLFGSARGVKYILTSCDYLNFKPIRIL